MRCDYQHDQGVVLKYPAGDGLDSFGNAQKIANIQN